VLHRPHFATAAAARLDGFSNTDTIEKDEEYFQTANARVLAEDLGMTVF